MSDDPGHDRPERDVLAFDRSDRWGLVGLLLAVSLAACWAWLVSPVVAWAEGEAIPLELTSRVSVPELDAAGLRHGLATYDVLLDDPTPGQRLLALAPGILHLVIVVAVCWLVWGLLRSVGAGDPFQPRNVTRLRLVAALLVLGTAVAFFLEMSTRGALTATLGTVDLEPAVFLGLPWMPMVAGMVVALLAEAFRTGSRLRDDVEGLI